MWHLQLQSQLLTQNLLLLHQISLASGQPGMLGLVCSTFGAFLLMLHMKNPYWKYEWPIGNMNGLSCHYDIKLAHVGEQRGV